MNNKSNTSPMQIENDVPDIHDATAARFRRIFTIIILIGVAASVGFFSVPYIRASNPAYKRAVNEWKKDVIKREAGLVRDIRMGPGAKNLRLILTYENQYENLTLPRAKLLLKTIRHEFGILSQKYGIGTGHLVIYIYSPTSDEIEFGDGFLIGESRSDKTEMVVNPNLTFMYNWPTY